MISNWDEILPISYILSNINNNIAWCKKIVIVFIKQNKYYVIMCFLNDLMKA